MKSFILPTLALEDVSKFGTFLNGKSIRKSGSNIAHLKHGDEIKFGSNKTSIFL